jgi:two-component system sensor histidine kinase BaeS
VAWQQVSFRRSFRLYLDQVALQHLQTGAEHLAERYTAEGGWQFLRRDPMRLREFLDAGWRHEDRQGAEGPDPADPPPPRADRPPPPRDDDRPPPPRDGEPPRDRDGPPRRGGPPRGPGQEFEPIRRVLLVDEAGLRIAGNPRVGEDAAVVPVVVNGRSVGSLRLAPLPALIDELDRGFAATQWQDALVAGILVLLGALAFAFALARWLLAPVNALAQGTRALAAGDFRERVAEERADELGALARDFNHLAATLEKNRDARRQWGADIAHELRTPLTILRGEIDALRDGIRPLGAEALASLQAECQRMSTLVEDLYQLSLADAGALDYRFGAVDIGALATDTVALQRMSFADAKLELSVDALPVPPIRGDSRRLEQLLDNLLGNARRYTDAPGRVQVRVTGGANEVVLSVDDTAPGVAPTHLPHLFERLYRVEASRNRAAGGAGLGLAICRAIVDAHGGRIEARPSTLGGLCVRVTLPVVREGNP